MHEMGIALQILDVAKGAMPPGMEGEKVEAVNLRVGKLTAVVPESLRFCFEIASQDTPLAGARLHIEEVPVRAVCRGCGARIVIDRPCFICTQCQGGDLEILSGHELIVSSIELADSAPSSGEN